METSHYRIILEGNKFRVQRYWVSEGGSVCTIIGRLTGFKRFIANLFKINIIRLDDDERLVIYCWTTGISHVITNKVVWSYDGNAYTGYRHIEFPSYQEAVDWIYQYDSEAKIIQFNYSTIVT